MNSEYLNVVPLTIIIFGCIHIRQWLRMVNKTKNPFVLSKRQCGILPPSGQIVQQHTGLSVAVQEIVHTATYWPDSVTSRSKALLFLLSQLLQKKVDKIFFKNKLLHTETVTHLYLKSSRLILTKIMVYFLTHHRQTCMREASISPLPQSFSKLFKNKYKKVSHSSQLKQLARLLKRICAYQ